MSYDFQRDQSVRIVGVGTMIDGEKCAISGELATGYIAGDPDYGMDSMIPVNLSLLSSGAIGETVTIERLSSSEDVI